MKNLNKNIASNYPMLFGRLSLESELPKIESLHQYDAISSTNKFFELYQVGDSSEIHSYEADRSSAVLFGRLYETFSVNPLETSPTNSPLNLSKSDLKNLSGSFIYFRIPQPGHKSDFWIATDKYGFRRLMYFLDGKILYFATHLNGFKILLENKLPGISTDSLLHYYNFGITSNEQTLFEGVRKLPPGSLLLVEDGTISVAPYFSVSDLYDPRPYAGASEDEICQAIDGALLDAVRRRIPAREPVGVALSGGVDSGYIAQKLVQAGANIIGYNLSYQGYYDEFDRVDVLAKALGIEVRKKIINPVQILENFEYLNSFCSEPMGFNNASMRFVALEARKDGVKTLFDGDGADRLFLGMNRYLLFQKTIRSYTSLKRFGLLPLIKPLLGLINNHELKKLHIHFQNWENGIPPYAERNMDTIDGYNQAYEEQVYELGIKKFWDRYQKGIGLDDFGLFFTFQAIQMCPEMFFYDPVEIQNELGLFPVPAFWDDRLVSLAMSLPTDWKLRQGKTKYILRKAAALNLDENYWMLPKIGLQDSFAYVTQSEDGRRWRDALREKVRQSTEYKILQEIILPGNIQIDRLIGLIVWKKYNNFAKL